MNCARVLRLVASKHRPHPSAQGQRQTRRSISSAAEAASYHPVSQAQPSISTSTAEPQTSRAERTLKRFWKDVHLVQDGAHGSWTILLDKRTLKTPSGLKLALPKNKMTAAMVIAHEWDSQENLLKPHSLPLTSLASRALEGMSDPSVRSEVIEALTRYLHTDTVVFHESTTPALTKLQKDHWVPLIDWVNKRYNTKVEIAGEGQLFIRQSPETVEALQKPIRGYDAFTLAAFERAVMASKSYIIALGLLEGQLSADAAAQAAHVEVQSQIERWGEVEDTHDVDHQDVRVRLGSAAIIMNPPRQ
ncbi:MAG: ATP synthase complex assembly protein atp12 [Cyphobasidiales sp. Tagirdzhanova-0007]|nr:MAG: ATP synthase complex assembly protein atp12 [Cyphobasidiales sp. Tagirdzhanova-0007]